ncbi:MAG: AIR synthase family protein [Candidatus Njordarchaeia archaeon]
MRLPQGKVPSEILKELFNKLKASNKRIVIGPKIGYDSAVIDIGEKYLVISNDPSGFLPESIPVEYFAFGAVHWAASDVAVFGAEPRWMIYTIIFPVGIDSDFVKKAIGEIEREASKINISIIGGHSGVYKLVKTTLASSTVFGEVDKKYLVTPSNIKDGDFILMTKELGLEIAVALAYEKEDELTKLIGEKEVRSIKKRFRELSTVKEALILSRSKFAHAMHDVTEGGLVTALNEMADNSNIGFTIEEATLSSSPTCRRIMEYFSINPLSVSSTGSLLAAVPPELVDEAISILGREGIPARVIGRFHKGGKFYILENGRKTNFSMITRDHYASMFE